MQVKACPSQSIGSLQHKWEYSNEEQQQRDEMYAIMLA